MEPKSAGSKISSRTQKVFSRINTPELKHLVTAKSARSTPIHDWYVFPHSFSPGLVDYLLERYAPLNTKPEGRLLDMFSGGGTAILRAKQVGLSADGIDIMPLSVHVGNAKLGTYEVTSIVTECNRLFENLPRIFPVPEVDVSLAAKIFHPDTLAFLFFLRERICDAPGQLQDFFVTALLRAADDAMSAVKAGGFTRNKSVDADNTDGKRRAKRTVRAESANPDEAAQAFRDHVKTMLSGLSNDLGVVTDCSISLGDARAIPKPSEPYRWVISSPPYPNRQDYTRVFAPELLLTYSASSEKHKSLRYATLRSHLEARPSKFEDPDYKAPAMLDQIEKDILANFHALRQQKREEAELRGQKFKFKSFDHRITRMIRGYFEDMHLVLRSLRPYLSHDAHVCLIVSNVRHLGVSVDVDTLLAEVASRAGYKCKEILVARERGNSAQQMRLYARKAVRESVVVLTPATN